ncbi:hypothetical protein Pfo_024472 [Paulownia fortunei]|nr:hypothetical protein Pfo_024472 [Paulownia fortunei]
MNCQIYPSFLVISFEPNKNALSLPYILKGLPLAPYPIGHRWCRCCEVRKGTQIKNLFLSLSKDPLLLSIHFWPALWRYRLFSGHKTTRLACKIVLRKIY